MRRVLLWVTALVVLGAMAAPSHPKVHTKIEHALSGLHQARSLGDLPVSTLLHLADIAYPHAKKVERWERDLEMGGGGAAVQSTTHERDMDQMIFSKILLAAEAENLPKDTKALFENFYATIHDEDKALEFRKWMLPQISIETKKCFTCINTPEELSLVDFVVAKHAWFSMAVGDAMDQYGGVLKCDGKRQVPMGVETMANAIVGKIINDPMHKDKDRLVKEMEKTLAKMSGKKETISPCEYVRGTLRQKGLVGSTGVDSAHPLKSVHDIRTYLRTVKKMTTNVDITAKILFDLAHLDAYFTPKPSRELDVCEQEMLQSMMHNPRDWNLADLWHTNVGGSEFVSEGSFSKTKRLAFKDFQKIVKTIDLGNAASVSGTKYNLGIFMPSNTLDDETVFTDNTHLDATHLLFKTISTSKDRSHEDKLMREDVVAYLKTLCDPSGNVHKQSAQLIGDWHGDAKKGMSFEQFYRGINTLPKLVHDVSTEDMDEAATELAKDKFVDQATYIKFMVLLLDYSDKAPKDTTFPQFVKKQVGPPSPKSIKKAVEKTSKRTPTVRSKSKVERVERPIVVNPVFGKEKTKKEATSEGLKKSTEVHKPSQRQVSREDRGLLVNPVFDDKLGKGGKTKV